MPANHPQSGHGHERAAPAELGFAGAAAELDELLGGALDQARTERALHWLLVQLRSPRAILGQMDDFGELGVVAELSQQLGTSREPASALGYPSEEWQGVWGSALTELCARVDNHALLTGPARLRYERGVAAPICFDGALIGLIFAADKQDAYEPADAQLLENFARRIAPVLAYTSTHQRFKRQLDAAEEMASAAAEGERFFMMSRDPMVITDGKVRRANAAFTGLLGLMPQELRGKSLSELTHPKDRALFEAELRMMRTEPNREHAPVAVEMITAGGEQRRVEWVGAATDDGTVYAVGRDITVLSWAMEDLAITNAELQRLHAEARAEEQVAARVIAHVRKQGCLDCTGIKYVTSPLGLFGGDVPLATNMSSGELRWVLADFTGHGLAAAIGTVPLAGAFHLACRRNRPFVEMIGLINDMLKSVLPPGLFCASAWFSLSPDGTELSLWNCGLPPVLVRRGQSASVEGYDSQSLPLGVLSTAELGITPTRIRVSGQDDVIAFTDGLSECTDESGQLFGVERIKAALSGDLAPGEGFEAIMREVASFRGQEQVKDDLSVMCVSIGYTQAGANVPDDSSSQGSTTSTESSQR